MHQFKIKIPAVKILSILCLIMFLFSCENKTTSPEKPHFPDLATYRVNWSFASEPLTERDFSKGKINYFNAQDFEMQDVYEDSLLTPKEMDDKALLLRNKLMPDSLSSDNYWAGIMQHLETPINITEIEYLELQVLENADIFADVPVTMHIDLGKMSEDFYRPGESSLPDQEDGIVVLDGILDYGEDVGLDRIPDGEVGDDPDDKYDNNKVTINGFEEYPEINGTEGNNILNTEDLNNNGMLDLDNSYIEFTINLDGTEYLVSTNSKGLKTYQIPVDVYEIFMDSGVSPKLDSLDYMRIWFEFPEETYVILISLTTISSLPESNSQNLIISGNSKLNF